MKRSFNISVKRSENYQSVELSEGFEGEFQNNEEFTVAKKECIERVKTEVNEQLKAINEKKFNLKV